MPPYETARQAREAQGLTLAQIAKQACLCPEYLRKLELHGSPNYGTARLLSRIYGCDIKLFLYGERGRTAAQQKSKSKTSTKSTSRAVGRRQSATVGCR